MDQLRDTRIRNELMEIEKQPNIFVNECEVKGLIREDFWVLWVKGRK